MLPAGPDVGYGRQLAEARQQPQEQAPTAIGALRTLPRRIAHQRTGSRVGHGRRPICNAKGTRMRHCLLLTPRAQPAGEQMTGAADSVVKSPRALAATAATAGLMTVASPSQPRGGKRSTPDSMLRGRKTLFGPTPPADRTMSTMSSCGSAAAPATLRAGGETAPSAARRPWLPEPPSPDRLLGRPGQASEGLFYKDYGAYYE